MPIVWHYTHRYAIGGILKHRAIHRVLSPKPSTHVEQDYCWFSTSPSLDMGAGYGMVWKPSFMRTPANIGILEAVERNVELVFNVKAAVLEQVIASKPYRIGVDLDKLQVDRIDYRMRHSVTIYGTRAPVPMKDWLRFEQLLDGRLYGDFQHGWEVSGHWTPLDLTKLENAIRETEALHGPDFLKATEPPWADVWARPELQRLHCSV